MATIQLMFLEDIDPISKTFKIFLDGSLGIVGASLFPKMTKGALIGPKIRQRKLVDVVGFLCSLCMF